MTHHVPGGTMSRDQITEHLAFAEAHIDSEDPYERQHAKASAARAYEALALYQDDMVLRMACQLAALGYQRGAARIRFANGIPTVMPKTEMELLGLRRCLSCGLPWQITPSDESCPDCPRLLFGPTPTSVEEVAQYPEPRVVDVTQWRDEFDDGVNEC